jgi:hypothetical protein
MFSSPVSSMLKQQQTPLPSSQLLKENHESFLIAFPSLTSCTKPGLHAADSISN